METKEYSILSKSYFLSLMNSNNYFSVGHFMADIFRTFRILDIFRE